jgi:hypothetical protein
VKSPVRWVLVTAVAVWLLLGSGRERTSGASGWDPAPGAEAAHGLPEWQVLAPRHRITSPVPLIVFATPGWLGSVEIRVETRTGVHAAVTTARSLPWPAALAPLEPGDWCAVTVSGAHGRSAEAACLRAAIVPGADSPDSGGALSVGLPSAACLEGGPDLGAALLRSGVDRLPASGASATMSRDRGRAARAPRPR